MDGNAARDEYGQMKTGLPLKMVGMGERELEMEGELETRGEMEEGRLDPSSGTVTKPSDPELDPEPGRH